MRADGLDIVIWRDPDKRRADKAGIRNHGHDVAGPARGMLDRKIAPADAPHRLDGFKYGMAAAATAIQRHRAAAAAQVRQRRAIGLRKVADVNEIPDAASVRGR